MAVVPLEFGRLRGFRRAVARIAKVLTSCILPERFLSGTL
jgi:hypothetical protein